MTSHSRLYLSLASLLFIALLQSAGSSAQTGTISGRVVDERGTGVPYSMVLLRGTQLGATAGLQGNFSILRVPSGTYVIGTRMIGYAPSEQTVEVNADRATVVTFRVREVPIHLYDWRSRRRVDPAPVATRADQEPSISAPASMAVTPDVPADLIVKAEAANLSDSLRVWVTGLPSGLQLVVGRQTGGQVQSRVYGIVDPSTAGDSIFPVAWSASDGKSSQTLYSTIRVERSVLSGAQFEDEVTKFYTVEYYHGLPRLKARGYGRRSLPILARLLRDPSAKRQWHQIVAGIGFVGDTAYFDTLRSFIWERFRGSVDFRTYMGLMQAQASLGAMATLSPRVRGYLETTARASAWDGLPWYSPSPDSRASVARKMRRMSVGSISYTDSDWATNLLSELSLAEQDPEIVEAVSIGREVNGKIRLRGLAQVWAEQDRRH